MTWADCCGCGGSGGDDLETGVQDPVAPFRMGVRSLGALNVHGKEDENRANLAETGGPEGLCAALASDPVKGISGTKGACAARCGQQQWRRRRQRGAACSECRRARRVCGRAG
jgi:hypothetical protein